MTSPAMHDKRASTVAVGFILLAGVALRLHGLGAYSLWYDEAASLYLGAHWDAPGDLFDPAWTSEPPLNTVMTGCWAAAVDAVTGLSVTDWRHDFLLRLLPFLFSVASLPLIYALAMRLFRDARAARYALLLMAISPFQIYYAQELRIYSAYVFIALVALWCMVRTLEEDRAWMWGVMVLALALLMYSHFIAMWLIFAFNAAFVLLLWKYRRHFWKWTAANAVLMVLIAPMLYRAFAMHAEVQSLAFAWYPSPTWKTVFITFKDFFAGYGPSAWAYWPLFLIALTLSAAAARHWRTGGTPLVLLASVTWIPVIGCALLWGFSDFSFYEHRLFIVSGVAATLLAAQGAASLGRWGLVAVATVVLFTVPCLADFYAGRLHPVKMHRLAMWDKVDFREAARYLETHWQPGDRLVYASHFSAYPMRHYFPRDQARLGWSEADETQFIQTMGHEAILRTHRLMPVPKEAAVAGAARLWFLATEGTTFEWQPATLQLKNWLDGQYAASGETRFPGVVVHLYTPR